MPIIKKFAKEKSNKLKRIMGKSKKGDEVSLIDQILGDISKASAGKQLLIGTGAGWITGYVFMKVGKVLAVAVGGGVILLQVANQNGYVRINWKQVDKAKDKVVDTVEEKITGEGPSWQNQVERFVDRKVEDAEKILRKKKRAAKRWYDINIIGDDGFRLQETHIFLVSFAAGLCFGFATA